MKVKSGNNYSETENIPSSVTQGSALEHLVFFKVINDFTNDIKSEIKLFADDVRLLVRLLSKEITQIDLNKLSFGRYVEIKI